LRDGATVHAKAVVLATGAVYRAPDTLEYGRFVGRGIHHAATLMEAQLCVGIRLSISDHPAMLPTTVLVAPGHRDQQRVRHFQSRSSTIELPAGSVATQTTSAVRRSAARIWSRTVVASAAWSAPVSDTISQRRASWCST